MAKAEACKVLQVAPTADEALVTQAYWYLARKVRGHARHDPEARRRLDELNRAYVVLNPAKGEAPLAKELPLEPEEPSSAQEFVTWFRRTVDETAARWPGRTAEVAVLATTSTLLAVLAFSAGASVLWTSVALAAALLAIWAPWRRF